MKTLLTLKYFFLLIPFYSINAQTTPNLIFKSSFDYNVTVDKSVVWNHHLSGTDQITNYTFPDDLPGDTAAHYFNYVVGDMDNYFEYANADIVTTSDANGNDTSALFIEFIKDDTNFVSYSRVQYAMYGDNLSSNPVERMNKGYIKYKIKTHLDHTDPESDWRLPIEWKDMGDNGFRMGLYIYDTNTTTPYWVVKGQYMVNGELGDDIWQYDNYTVPVTEDDWFELEVYWDANADASLGKLKVAINNQVLFDITNQTKDPNFPDKMFYFMPFKVYGTVGYSWITDFEYWNIPPSNSVLFDSQLSTDEINISNTIFYPNPVEITMNINKDFLEHNYQIFNVSGQLIHKGVCNTEQIDISEIENGIYFIKFDTTNKVYKFIKK